MKMMLDDFLAHMNAGKTVIAGSETHLFMIELANDAMRITSELNSSYKTADKIR